MLVWPGKNQRFMVGGTCLRAIELHRAQRHAAQRGRGQQGSDIDGGVRAQHRVVVSHRVAQRRAIGQPYMGRAAARHRGWREAMRGVTRRRLSVASNQRRGIEVLTEVQAGGAILLKVEVV